MKLISYLFKHFFYRIKEFFRHWYIKSFFIYSNFVVSLLERLDRFFALKITFRFIFQPLYSDRSVIGYILGFIFRLARLIIASMVYLSVILIAVFLYLVWLTIPIYLIIKIFIG
ncbi:MAG: hypothetical protein AAB596_00975 [Patescibacteria group bacterium]